MNSNQLKRRFNLIARFYTPVKRIVLGDDPEFVIQKAIQNLRDYSNILIVGGGADNTLSEIITHQKARKVSVIDISSNLLQEARLRIQGLDLHGIEVEMINSAFLAEYSTQKYDVVIFPFYLDLFSDKEVMQNIVHLKTKLKDSGLVVVIDFSSRQKLGLLNKSLIAALYVIFIPISGLIRFSIPPYFHLFSKCGFHRLEAYPSQNKLYETQTFAYTGS